MTRTGPAATSGAVLAIDQGTTNTKALLLDADTGAVVSESSEPAAIRFPAPGWVEQDAEQLWAATVAAIDACLAPCPDVQVVGIGISTQRETAVCWSRSTGRALGPALGWQDARTAAWCDDLTTANAGAAQLVHDRTGLALDPMFSAPKFRAAVASAVAGGADRRDVAVGTVDSWIIWKLTGEHLTELGNASRTLLLGLRRLAWDDDLLDLFGIEAQHLAEVLPSDAGFGSTTGELARIGPGVPVAAVLADSHAALYHHGCTTPGTGKATYGTGTSVMSPTGDLRPAPEGIATTIAWHTGGRPTYAREGNIVASGSALDWMATTLGAPDGAAGGAFLSALASTVPDSGGVSFVPAFSGLGAPHWDRSAVGILTGVSGGTGRAHLARAALEAVAHQVADVVEAMDTDAAARIQVLHADGGATASELLMQTQADLLARPVEVADSPAASALGAARLAAERLGVATPALLAGERVDPSSTSPVRARAAWARAVSRARGKSVAPQTPVPGDGVTERNS